MTGQCLLRGGEAAFDRDHLHELLQAVDVAALEETLLHTVTGLRCRWFSGSV
jgi:hypothetical protein